jgi:hypothetical protein
MSAIAVTTPVRSARSRAARPILAAPDRRSPAAGDYAFVHDPDAPAERASAFWRPEVSPGTLILAPPPPGFDALPLVDPADLGPILADHTDAEGRRLVIGDVSGDLHVWLPEADAVERLAVILPPDGAAELRLDVASRFIHRLQGRRIALLPRALQLTPFQRAHLVLLLLAHDVHEAGGGPRDVATEVIRSMQAVLPSTEWKDSAARRRASRLIHDALALVNGGYLRLLRGQ